MEEEHPIPQQISSYQFRLVGDMTLKQFFQVAGGALVAILIYSSSLTPILKWPLIAVSFLTGVALAFVPLQDRPLSKWIVLFVKAVYSPTLYIWKKDAKRLPFFQPEPHEISPGTSQVSQTPFESTLPLPKEEGIELPELTKLEKGEEEFLSKVSQQFSSASEVSPQTADRKTGQEATVPKEVYTSVEKSEKPTEVPTQPLVSTPTGFGITRSATQATPNAQTAQFSLDAAPPSPPTKANIIVGQVIDREGKIVENAILEIRDSEGRPARALRSNKLGHFMIVTPLTSGKYVIITEKEGLNFEAIEIEVKGVVIPPIAIKAKN